MRGYSIDSDSDPSDDDTYTKRESKWNSNITTLVTAFVLFMGIAIVQSVGAVYANSLALLGDATSMGVDAFSFLGNLYAECNQGSKNGERDRLISSACSVLILMAVTVFFIVDAIKRLLHPVTTMDEAVNPQAVMGFAVMGLIFDIISGVMYCRGRRKNRERIHEENPGAAQLNMHSAMLHIASDSIRSITTLIESLLIILGHLNPGETDTVSSLVVSGLILAGCIGTCFEWFSSARSYWQRKGFEPISMVELT